jgi:4'-phosphopantetheinyl transferase
MHENAAIRSLAPEHQLEAFYYAWTRREAYLKATGKGLVASTENIEISLIPRDLAELAEMEPDRQAAARWHVESFRPAAGYVAALVVEGGLWQLDFRTLPCACDKES